MELKSDKTLFFLTEVPSEDNGVIYKFSMKIEYYQKTYRLWGRALSNKFRQSTNLKERAIFSLFTPPPSFFWPMNLENVETFEVLQICNFKFSKGVMNEQNHR